MRERTRIRNDKESTQSSNGTVECLGGWPAGDRQFVLHFEQIAFSF